MDSRPATQASTGRHLLRSAIAEAVASDPAQRVVASIRSAGLAQPHADLGGPRRRGRPHRRSDHRDHAADRHSRRRHIGHISAGGRCHALRAGTGDAPARPAPRRPALRSPPPTPEPPSAPGTRLRSARAAATGPPARATASTADCSSPHRPGVPSAARVCRTRPAVPSRSLSPNACSPPKAGRPGPPAPTSSACADQSPLAAPPDAKIGTLRRKCLAHP